MGVYINQTCKKCGSSLTGWIPNYYVVEEPYVICPKCRAYNDRSAKANEWKLSSFDKKAAHILLALYWDLGYGLLMAVGIIFFLKEYFPGFYNVDTASLPILLTPWLGSFITGCFISFGLLFRKIQESKLRMEKQECLNLLVDLGYAPNKQ